MEKIVDAVAQFEKRMDDAAEVFGQVDEELQSAFLERLKHIHQQEQNIIDHLRVISRRQVKALSHMEENCTRLIRLSKNIVDRKARKGPSNHTHWSLVSVLFDPSVMSTRSSESVVAGPHQRSFFICNRVEKIAAIVHHVDIAPHSIVHEGFFPITRTVSTISSAVETFSTSKCGHKVAGPWGLAIHPITGNVFVAERMNSCILELDPDLRFVKAHKCMKTSDGFVDFNSPIGVGISSEGMIAVVEYNKHQMRLLDSDFRLIRTVGKQGKSTGDFSYPYFVQFDPEDNMYLSDNSNGCIHKFDSSGKLLFDLAEHKSPGSVGVPSGVAVLESGVVIGIGCGKSVVKCFASDGSFKSEISLPESTASGSYNHLARGPGNTFVLSDKGNNRVCVVDLSGTVLLTFGANGPVGAAFGINNRLYVAESAGNRVCMF